MTGFKVIMWCWSVPFALGVLTFLLWLILRWHELEQAGLWVILLGFLATLIGATSGFVLMITRWTRSRRPMRQAILPVFWLMMLLASNFAVALLFIWIVSLIENPPYF